MTTIKQIAEQCNVSPSTVSRALNAKAGVSDEVRKRIIEVADKLAYKSELVANTMSLHKPSRIGLLIPDITNMHYLYITKGVMNYFRRKNTLVEICSVERDQEMERCSIAQFCDDNVNGILMMSVTATDEDLRPIFEKSIPVVAMDNPICSAVPSVINDNYVGTAELIRHILDAGIRRIAMLMGSDKVFTTKQRMLAVFDTIERYGLPESTVVKTMHITPTYADAYNAAKKILEYKPEAIFAINDEVALGVMSYCHDNGIKIPEEIKIAGYDDIPYSAMMAVPLTTVHQHNTKLGWEAASMLHQKMQDPTCTPKSVLLNPYLVVRSSVGEGKSRFNNAPESAR